MNHEAEIWETVESREIADCRVFKIREDVSRNGAKAGKFYVMENPDWVNVIAVTKDAEVVLIEQFRHGSREIIMEIPGGMIDGGEEPETAARRELLEETGFTAKDFVYLGKSRPNPAIQNNWIYHFAAFEAEKTGAVKFDEHESVATRLHALDAVPKLIQTGEITHSLAITAFYYFSFYRPRV